MTTRALSFEPCLSTFGTDTSRIKGIPDAAARIDATPAVSGTRFPFAFRTIYLDLASHRSVYDLHGAWTTETCFFAEGDFYRSSSVLSVSGDEGRSRGGFSCASRSLKYSLASRSFRRSSDFSSGVNSSARSSAFEWEVLSLITWADVRLLVR